MELTLGEEKKEGVEGVDFVRITPIKDPENRIRALRIQIICCELEIKAREAQIAYKNCPST